MGMTIKDFRRIALSMEGAEEGSLFLNSPAMSSRKKEKKEKAEKPVKEEVAETKS